MPLNYQILRGFGTTNERLKGLFTAQPSPKDQPPGQEKSESQKDWEFADQIIRGVLSPRLDEAVRNNLEQSDLLRAVDLAIDTPIINKVNFPLVLYAQGRISFEECVNQLSKLDCKDRYVKQGEDKKLRIEVPKFTDTGINYTRSVLTRRLAAQNARFSNLNPFFRYEARDTAETAKLRADALSQVMDIMADQYGWRSLQVDWMRDLLLYPHVIVFPAEVWNVEIEYAFKDEALAEEFQGESDKLKELVKRQGVPFIIPHPSRVFYDVAHSVRSINADSGCEYFGYWDVVRYRTIRNNPNYFNRDKISFNTGLFSSFGNFSYYFSQYYTTVSIPITDTAMNDRLGRTGYFYGSTSGDDDAPVCLAHLYWKVKPKDYRMGEYPLPVWIHLVLANNTAVIGAEIMPDCPGFVGAYNVNVHRLLSLSMAMEVMPFQDQLSNLYTALIETVKRDLLAIWCVNEDCFPSSSDAGQQALKDIEDCIKGDNWSKLAVLLKASFIKYAEKGVDLNAVLKVITPGVNTKIQEVLTCINLTIMLAERVLAMSPQEQGQVSQRETSALDVQLANTAVENIYQFISDTVDEMRAAMKRYLYNAMVSCWVKESTFQVSVVNRYDPKIAEKAGFNVIDVESIVTPVTSVETTIQGPGKLTIVGTKRSLIGEYLFNSRDGAERTSNMMAAQTLIQLFGMISQPATLQAVTWDQYCGLFNTAVRLTGAGVNLVIQPPPGKGSQPVLTLEQATGSPGAVGVAPGTTGGMAVAGVPGGAMQ